MPRKGKTIRERLAALGFTAIDPDDRVHDLLDAYEARLVVCEKALAEREAELIKVRGQLGEIIAELRNYVLNGSDAVKQIRGIYADLEVSTRTATELRKILKTVRAHFAPHWRGWKGAEKILREIEEVT